MKKILCLVVAAVMLLALTACNTANGPGNTGAPVKTGTDNPDATPAQDPQTENSAHRDMLTVAISREPKSLIPYGSNDTGTSYIVSQIYEALLATDQNMQLIPCLATSWEQVDDTHYRFHLRDDVTFHNGVKFTAADVLYTFEQNSASEATASTIGPVDIANCVIEDDYTIVIALSDAYPAFLNICSLDIASIVCKQAMEADPQGYAAMPIGTGPFKFVEWATGDHLTFDANTEWWGGKINFDKLLLRYIPEASTRAIEAESGGVDIAHVTVSDAGNIEANPDKTLLVQQILNTAYVSFNCSVAPFDNVKVRQAISLAIDKDAIVKATYLGYGEVAKSFLAPNIWGYHEAESEYSGYNVEKAKQLMAEAGYADGFACTMVSNASQSTAEMVQAFLKQIGIEVTLNVTDFSNWLDAIVNGKQEMYIGGWTVPSGDATEAFSAFDSANFGSGGNRSFYANADVDALIATINTETDSSARYQACVDLQELLADECVTIGLNVGVTLYAYDNTISGFYVLPTQSPVFANIVFAK